jgi:hypothetical protein
LHDFPLKLSIQKKKDNFGLLSIQGIIIRQRIAVAKISRSKSHYFTVFFLPPSIPADGANVRRHVCSSQEVKTHTQKGRDKEHPPLGYEIKWLQYSTREMIRHKKAKWMVTQLTCIWQRRTP